MSCANCGKSKSEPIETYGEDDIAVMAFWFLVQKDGPPVEAVGIEANGELALRFCISESPQHPKLKDGQEALCPDCFLQRYPDDEEDEEDEPDEPWKEGEDHG